MIYLCALSVYAQESIVSKADRFSYDSLYSKVRNENISVKWIDGGRWFWYTLDEKSSGDEKDAKDGKATRHWYLVDTRNWKRQELFDPASMAEQLSKYSDKAKDSGKGVSPKSIPLYEINFDKSNPRKFSFRYNKHTLAYANGILREIKEDADQKTQQHYRFSHNFGDHRSFCADSAFAVYSVGHDIVLDRLADGKSIRLTDVGEKDFSFASGGGKDIPDTLQGYAIGRWMGDSHYYFLVREDKRKVGELYLVDNLAQPRPTLKSYKFPMPGDEFVTQYDAWIVDADSMKIRKVDIDRWKDQKVEIPRFGFFTHTSDAVWFIRRSRTLDNVDLCKVDFRSKRLTAVISEKCEPTLNDQQFGYHILNDGKDIIWWSERTGWGHWYIYDGDGNFKGAITSGEYVAGPIERIDTTARTIVYEGYGRENGINPHYRLHYKASLNGGEPVLLTPDNGDHSITFSPDGKYIVDTWSRMDKAPVHQMRDLGGRLKMELGKCDLSDLYAMGWQEPKVVEVFAADSTTRLYGVVYLPFDLDTTRKYPIISSVYPGPHMDLVPQAFALDDNYNQSLAQLGIIVINFSYRGSGPWRGHDFHSFGYGNLRDYALADDKAVIQQLAKKYKFIDIDRVGIYGHSGGGFMTAAAMLNYPEFYKVGVAASGNHDNNIYTQWWGETFHGVHEITDHGVHGTTDKDGNVRFECRIPTNIELADRLNGKLLLITGDMDNNVHPASTFRLANALIKAGKHFDMFVIPGADHGLGDKYYVNLIRYYFVDNLLGQKQEDIDIIRHTKIGE